MSRGLGRIERAIAAEIQRESKRVPLLLNSWTLAYRIYQPVEAARDPRLDWSPSIAQQKAIVRAMHSFVRKHQQYALIGGQGRKRLFFYDSADPNSVAWAELSASKPGFVPFCEVGIASPAA